MLLALYSHGPRMSTKRSVSLAFIGPYFIEHAFRHSHTLINIDDLFNFDQEYIGHFHEITGSFIVYSPNE